MRLRTGREYTGISADWGCWQDNRTLPDCLAYAILMVLSGDYTILKDEEGVMMFRRPYVFNTIELYEFEGREEEVAKLRELVCLWENVRSDVLKATMPGIINEAMGSNGVLIQIALGYLEADRAVEVSAGPLLLAIMGASEGEIAQLGQNAARVLDAAAIANLVLSGDIAGFDEAVQVFAS